jgi:hypothetical protein
MTSQIRALALKLSKPVQKQYEAAAIAAEIVALSARNPGLAHDIDSLKERFGRSLTAWGLDDLLPRQIQYAIRLARSEGDLLYEEMHKLFSLRDEIDALQSFGLRAEQELEQELEKALRDRFRREGSKAHLVAQDRFEEWKTGWWYTENL